MQIEEKYASRAASMYRQHLAKQVALAEGDPHADPVTHALAPLNNKKEEERPQTRNSGSDGTSSPAPLPSGWTNLEADKELLKKEEQVHHRPTHADVWKAVDHSTADTSRKNEPPAKGSLNVTSAVVGGSEAASANAGKKPTAYSSRSRFTGGGKKGGLGGKKIGGLGAKPLQNNSSATVPSASGNKTEDFEGWYTPSTHVEMKPKAPLSGSKYSSAPAGSGIGDFSGGVSKYGINDSTKSTFSVPQQTHESEAERLSRFQNKKSISSSDYFGNSGNSGRPTGAAPTQFEGAQSISSDMYFNNKPQRSSESYGADAPDLSHFVSEVGSQLGSDLANVKGRISERADSLRSGLESFMDSFRDYN